MDLSALRQQILSSSKTASEKAEVFLLKRQVNDLSKDEWRELIAGIPEDVERGIGMLKSAGIHLHRLFIPARLLVVISMLLVPCRLQQLTTLINVGYPLNVAS